MLSIVKKSKGFTLVELLIVIIIIGILAGMLMLSAGSATDKAEATKVVANMRTIKAGCLLFYADKGNWPSADDTGMSGVTQFIDVSVDTSVYTLDKNGSGGIVVKATPSAGGLQAGVYNKIGALAKDAGIYTANTCGTSDVATASLNNGSVYMLVKRQ